MARALRLIFVVLTMCIPVSPAAATYAARGNVTSNGPTGFSYDFANQPTALTGAGAANYTYDGNFKRVKSVSQGKTIYTVYSQVSGGLIYRDELSPLKRTDYVNVGGASLRLENGAPVYTHKDHLGSPVAATDGNGAVLWRESYSPFGRTLNGAAGVKKDENFTGHLRDDNIGLIYMQARYYDYMIGRFYSTDPIGYQDQLNLYAYVANDPVNKVDPTGETSEELRQQAMQDLRDSGQISNADFQAYNNGSLAGGAVGAGVLAVAAGGIELAGAALANPAAATEIAVGVGEIAMGDAAGPGLVASSAVAGNMLGKELASASQMSQLAEGGGKVISQPAQQAERIAAQTGANPSNIRKVSSDAFVAKDGQQIQTHAFRDASTNKVIEPKTIIDEPR